MEILKEILDPDFYGQLEAKINEHNGNEANKDKQIRLRNLATGQYVSKDKFEAQNGVLASREAELTNANKLIEELKKGTKNNQELQQKISEYDVQVADLQKQLAETQIKSAIKIALMSEKALDVDYLTFKLNEKMAEAGETLELDELGNIKGWKDKIDGLKIQFPHQFESASQKKIDEHKLEKPDNDQGTKISKEEFNKMGYKARVELKEANPDLYNTLVN